LDEGGSLAHVGWWLGGNSGLNRREYRAWSVEGARRLVEVLSEVAWCLGAGRSRSLADDADRAKV
jgi:hypothetical protein